MHDNRLIRLVYNHNPFYLISACLVLYGARTSISSGHSDVGSDLWSLATILAGCTVVMAITAFLIVRFGRVWYDARSIFMVLLLMFFAISVSFDELLLTDTHLAITMLAAGFAFSLIVTELIVISLRIKFPLKYRLPYYLLLSLTFFYSLVFAADTAWSRTLNTRWLLLLFPAITGLTILSLLPAIRAGGRHFWLKST